MPLRGKLKPPVELTRMKNTLMKMVCVGRAIHKQDMGGGVKAGVRQG